MATMQTISPIDGRAYVEREYANANDIAKALALAESAQMNWQKISLPEKQNIMRNAMAYFKTHQAEIAEEITWQMGRPIQYSQGEINGLIERASYMTDIAETALADIVPAQKTGFKRFMRREALGTVFVIAPWNYPYLTAVNTIVPALLAGNTIILKHSSQTPLCAERFSEAFKAAGLPEGVFQYLHLTHTDTETIAKDERIRFVAFTGSVAAGKHIQKTIAGRLIGAGLELGGKDPAYVRADADLNHAVENLVDGAFFNSGQSCCGIERIYVHKNLYASFIEQFVEKTKTYQLGNPSDPKTSLGPMVHTKAANFVRQEIEKAVSQGAKALIPESHFPASQIDTPYLAPQVLSDVNHNMSIMTEENFGPVVGIMPVNSDEEAIQLMNDSQYGLTASIWTKDENVALNIASQLKTGTCFMNRCDYLDPALAWTGVKETGIGISLSSLGFEQLTQVKSYHFRLSSD